MKKPFITSWRTIGIFMAINVFGIAFVHRMVTEGDEPMPESAAAAPAQGNSIASL